MAEGATPLGELPPLEFLKLQDARSLCYRNFGAPVASHPAHGLALYFHGTPSCHLEAQVMDREAARLGLALVSMDRPGIGLSTYKRNSTLESVAEDARQLMVHLGSAQASVIGTSGGGPYAAAFAALFPEATTSLVLIAPLAPTDRGHKSLLRSLTGPDRLQFGMAKWPVGGVWALHGVMRYMALRHPKTLLEHAPEGLAAVDGKLMRENEDVKAGFGACLKHAYAGGSKGMARDVRALGLRWQVDLSKIKCKTTIWHGEEDISVPLLHGQWYRDTISGSELSILPGEGHVTPLVNRAVDILQSALLDPLPQAAGAQAEPTVAGGPLQST